MANDDTANRLREQEARARKGLKREFGRRLHERMIAKGWTQSELGRRTDLGRNNISTYIRGQNLPSPSALAALTSALGCEPKDLIPETTMGVVDLREPELSVTAVPGEKDLRHIRINARVRKDIALRIQELLDEGTEE